MKCKLLSIGHLMFQYTAPESDVSTSLNARSSNDVSDDGRMTSFSHVQFANACAFTRTRLVLLKLTHNKLSHPSNALYATDSLLLMLCSIAKDLNDKHPLNACSGIELKKLY